MTSHPSGIEGGRDGDHVPTSTHPGTKKPREKRGLGDENIGRLISPLGKAA